MCLSDTRWVMLRLDQWLGSFSLMKLIVQSNSISYWGVGVSRSWFRWDRFRCRFLSVWMPIKLILWMIESIQLFAVGWSCVVCSRENAIVLKMPRSREGARILPCVMSWIVSNSVRKPCKVIV